MNTDNKRKVGQEEGISSKRGDEQFQSGQQQDYSKRMDPQQGQGQDVNFKGDQQRVSGQQKGSDIGQQNFPYQQQGQQDYGNEDVAGKQGKIGTSRDISNRMGSGDINPEPAGMGSDIKTQRTQQSGQFEGGVKGQQGQQGQEDWLKQGGLQGQQQGGLQGQQQGGLQGQQGGLQGQGHQQQGGLQHEQRDVGKVHEGDKPSKGKSPQQGRKGEKDWGETPSKKGDMSQEEWARQHKEERTAQQQTK